MIKNNPIVFYIIAAEKLTFQWLSATIYASNLNISSVHSITINALDKINETSNSQIVLFIEKKIYLKKLKFINDSLGDYFTEVPILLLTDELEYRNVTNNKFSVIDSIVRSNLSLNLIEHVVLSLVNDFFMTQKLKKLAHYDALTGAANRNLFQDRLEQTFIGAKRIFFPFAVFSFDLNGFKKVNDTYGHYVGDLLLQKFVFELKKVKRESDTIARLGGDEFTMIVKNISSTSLDLLSEKIINSFEDDFYFSGNRIKIRTSIGIVLVNDKSQLKVTPSQILKLADEAVYEAKRTLETNVIIKILD